MDHVDAVAEHLHHVIVELAHRPFAADEVVVVHIPEFFGAVSQFYRNFAQVEDDEVAQLLAA